MIVLLLLFVNSFVGNPVSNALAKKAALEYVSAEYADLDLELQRCSYNFKSGAYFAFFRSSTSPDTAFSIHVSNFGAILQDDYPYEVANNFTTFRRLDEELREIAKEILGPKLNYDLEHVSLSFVQEADIAQLQLDMQLNVHEPPLPLEAFVAVYSNDLSYNKVAEVSKALEAILQQESIPVEEYSVLIVPLANKPEDEDQAASWINSQSVFNFPASRMAEENLPQVMEQFETTKI